MCVYVCVYACVCMCACMHACMYELRIVSTDNILCFIKSLIIIHLYQVACHHSDAASPPSLAVHVDRVVLLPVLHDEINSSANVFLRWRPSEVHRRHLQLLDSHLLPLLKANSCTSVSVLQYTEHTYFTPISLPLLKANSQTSVSVLQYTEHTYLKPNRLLFHQYKTHTQLKPNTLLFQQYSPHTF